MTTPYPTRRELRESRSAGSTAASEESSGGGSAPRTRPTPPLAGPTTPSVAAQAPTPGASTPPSRPPTPPSGSSTGPATTPTSGPREGSLAAEETTATRRATSTPSRAGRNLPAAIAVGVGLAGVIVASLALRKEAFLVILVLAVGAGVWELRRALVQANILVPLVPSLVGMASMVGSAYYGGGQALGLTLGLTCIGILLWRVADGVADAMRDVAGGMFVALYPSFLAGFCALLLAAPDGARRVFVFILVTVLSDIGGYVFGVLWGRHPMAPSVSPKKSWEGFAGSVVACMVGASFAIHYALDGPWWSGLILGAVVAVGATVGDLTESTVKRDLGIKDMSHILPGHGGVMDRLDSLLLTAPLTWALLSVFVPNT